MGTGINFTYATQKNTRNVPTVGMRGGLGRTLLTAFLLLTILPLVLIGSYAARQNKNNIEGEAEARLLAIATLKAESLLRASSELESLLRLSTTANPVDEYDTWKAWWLRVSERIPGLHGILLQDATNTIVWSQGNCETKLLDDLRLPADSQTDVKLGFNLSQPLGLITTTYNSRSLVICFDESTVKYLLGSSINIGETGQIELVVNSTIWPSDNRNLLIASSFPRNEILEGQYVDNSGVLHLAAYYPLPWDGVGILVKQAEVEVMNNTDRITAALIGLILSVALGTTIIAAVVIRQITRPVINLTESALAMAEGNLDQHLEVKSRDEIGILTFVFNKMAEDLKSLYEDLEAKVVERTKRLQRANYQIQRRAIHLQASQEVSQAITSVRDPDQLLTRVVDVIRDRFVYSAVAIYIIPPAGGSAFLSAVSPRISEMRTTDRDKYRVWPEMFSRGDGSVVDKAMDTCEIQIERKVVPQEDGWYQRISCRVAIPLKMEGNVIGIIGVDTAALDGIQDDELEVLELLGNQVAIALQNARAYEREHLAIEQLEAAEAFKSRFLGNMSHELREPLNTVIGFSRLLMKGIDGSLNEQQLQDVEQIYNDSQRLLFLINDILAISQIQAGLMELKLQPVEVVEVIEGIMPTASALVRGKEIELIYQIPDDIPPICADANRLRQVLIHLLNNAAKFTHKGRIKIRVWLHDAYVFFSVIDTGIGIPMKDRERIFTKFERVNQAGDNVRGAGLGLALCKEFVELHGGKIWVDSEVNAGSTFTFSIPVYEEVYDVQSPHIFIE